MYEKQAMLESTKAGVNDLLRKKPNAYGSNILQNELNDITTKWKSLHDLCKNRYTLYIAFFLFLFYFSVITFLLAALPSDI